MSFGLEFFDLTPTLRVSGDSIAFVRKFTKAGGQGNGALGLEVGLIDDAELQLLQGVNVDGYRNIVDRDAAYTAMVESGLVELVVGEFALSTDAISRIETIGNVLELGIAGSQPRIRFEQTATVASINKVNDTLYQLSASAFAALETASAAYQSSVRTKILAVIADYMAADAAIVDGVDFTGKITAPAVGNIVPFLFADQSEFPAASAAHGAVAHSHADGALYFAHAGAWHELAKEADLQTTIASLANESASRIAADDALGARLDVLEADPTTATAVAAVQSDVDQNEADADAAIAAVQADVDQNEADADAAIAAETAARAAAITAEETARSSADTTLQSNIDAEATARAAADTAEATARAAGDVSTLSSANSYTDTAITNLKGTAPLVLDTLGEIAQAINDDANVYTTLVGQIAAVQSDVDGNEADADAAIAAESAARTAAVSAVQADVDQNEADADAAIAAEITARTNADTALSGRLDTLEADPTTATAVAAVQADVDANETASDAAEAALSARLDVLEADPTTATALAAVQADVDQNEADSDAAEAALSARLDTLEADSTTATAVAAVQADVDQNEADADAALALKAPLADPDFTGILEVDTNARLEFDSNLTKVHNVLRGTSIVIGNNITLNPAAADGRVEVEGEFYLRPSDLTDAADDTAAAAAGIIVGQVYRNGSQLMVRVS